MDRARQSPRGPGAQKAQHHGPRAYVPETPVLPHMEKRGVHCLPLKISPPRFPEGPRHRGPSSANATESHLQATPSLPLDWGPLHSRHRAAPALHSGAEPTPWTPRQWPGGHFRRAPEGGGPPAPCAPLPIPAVPTNRRARPQATSHRLRCLLCADAAGLVVRSVPRESAPRGSDAPQVGAPVGADALWARLPPRCRVLRES